MNTVRCVQLPPFGTSTSLPPTPTHPTRPHAPNNKIRDRRKGGVSATTPKYQFAHQNCQTPNKYTGLYLPLLFLTGHSDLLGPPEAWWHAC